VLITNFVAITLQYVTSNMSHYTVLTLYSPLSQVFISPAHEGWQAEFTYVPGIPARRLFRSKASQYRLDSV